MEDVLDLYAEPYDPQRPVVCFDETSTQLLAETRPPLPPRPGLPLRQDYEYRREGVRNLFLACEPLAGWREVAVTELPDHLAFAAGPAWSLGAALPSRLLARRGCPEKWLSLQLWRAEGSWGLSRVFPTRCPASSILRRPGPGGRAASRKRRDTPLPNALLQLRIPRTRS